MTLLTALGSSVIKNPPRSPFVKGGQCMQENFPSLEKRARGDFWSVL
jgi:hypothetical protein